MTISKVLQERLSRLDEQRDEYHYSGSQNLYEKTLARLVAPTAVGKSTIINRVLGIAKEEGIDAGEVGTITTRSRRPNDPPNYQTAEDGITHEMMIERIENKELVSWSLFKTGHIYATDYDSYPARYNFLPCLPDSLSMQDKAGFGAVRTFYVVTSVEAWYEQLQERIGPGFGDRLEEAMSSLEFSQRKEELHKFVSLPGNSCLSRTAERVLNHTINGNATSMVHGMIYGPMELYVKDNDFDNHCRDLYRLAIQLVNEVERP